ncbi:MAG TPA: galactokinase [Longimicrobiales bacterium]
MPREKVEAAFAQRFGCAAPVLVRAPGRVNIIGEHTDYNDGFVLPMAIDRTIWIALRPRTDGLVAVHSLDYDSSGSFDLGHIAHGGEAWLEYIKGIAWGMASAGHLLSGWEGIMGGDVPRGAGLSSSAAVEMATARAFVALAGRPWQPERAARLGQKVENEWIGVNSGIMDQTIVAGGREDHALLIDCRSLEATPVPLPPGVAVVILDTATRRGLVDSAYNERRQQCEQAARFFGVSALRDLDLSGFEAGAEGLDPVARRRARHVVTENARTLEAADAMHAGDVARLGQLMNASHASLRDDFEVTNDALDAIVDLAQRDPACYGARMTGAGFGGCAVALVSGVDADRFIDQLSGAYRARTGLEARAYVCRAAAGASVERGLA